MLKFIHHLLEPHCEECRLERQDERVCKSCETLKTALDAANFDKKILLARILELTQPKGEAPVSIPTDLNEVRARHIPWNMRRQMLEEEDRKKAQVLRAVAAQERGAALNVERGPSGGLKADILPDPTRDESIEKLEKELGLDDERRENVT